MIGHRGPQQYPQRPSKAPRNHAQGPLRGLGDSRTALGEGGAGPNKRKGNMARAWTDKTQ
eukprot:2921753-Lingulodinium_polyedra.AAC.1